MPDTIVFPSVGRVILVGNFPPRRCGIATFTADLRKALIAARPDLECSTLAMTDPSASYVYPPEVAYEIRQDEPSGYAAAAEHINTTSADIVCLQHEYGIFGGSAGDYVLPLLRQLRAPLVTTLHTVLADPSVEQRRVLASIVDASSRVIVMTEIGREFLVRSMGVSPGKIAVIPHGIPDIPFLDPAFCKDRFDLDGRQVVLTFGLLSRNKGIEVMIEALPAIVADHPNVMYVVLGATHPHVLACEGEAYRDELTERAARLGVDGHVRFVNEFVEPEVLQAYLTAADIYVTPYLNEAQITSGTLAYSVGMGKAVVSTPYWHARELLADDRGALVPFGDPAALAATIGDLFHDERRRNRLRRNAYAAGRGMVWSHVANMYLAEFAHARTGQLGRPVNVVNLRLKPPRLKAPEPCLEAVARMTDSCGMLQHSISSVPDRAHGYCLDDNARALILMHEIAAANINDRRIAELTMIYAAFVNQAWDDSRGRFRNFMAFDRRWLEETGSEDSFGRGLWAVGVTAARTADHGLKLWATKLADRIIPQATDPLSLRTWMFSVLGLVEYVQVYPGHRHARACLDTLAGRLHSQLTQNYTPQWPWFENSLAYDNARLPEALIRAGGYLGQARLVQDGLAALDWLMRVQTAPSGNFRPVGTDSFGRQRQMPLPFDQQALEAWASIAACEAAHVATGEARWLGEAERAYAWFHGGNDLGARVATPGGGCYDGLHIDRVNLNQGAESILAYQFATCAALRLSGADREAGSRIASKP